MFEELVPPPPTEVREEYVRMKKRLAVVKEGIMLRGTKIPYDLRVEEEILRANIAHYALLWGFTE
ncbi:hypothetical protein UFOVP1064_71 [uncultured Caudovirales phage]|uniref:Uncharacterized protein n=1 Tax=uncultured Caudovirales phage TaxID=2100421 RepID=A0A6J5RDB7_9CAUD|nr:hypothetical protein UFOVP659_4 [uncultured Caudovirales phage]CAB4169548.1 hypothetical protein UFOVP885_57 [uncultured Caudovirales phage]CAB4181864.1 hypothetical protein UFOVP1064_71 [uncultured Caudovirales phage]CAB4190495.1 hypothetical protein UFOVP1197_66 [uncultured Caudovirales phage]CAB4195570.1 hypothetical protein UFOVP1294_24 [uncultured Caudovirales phage]